MLDNFYLLKEVSSYLQIEIRGYLIKDIFTQEKDKLVLHFSDNSSEKFIEFSCAEKLPYIFLKNDYKKAKRNVLSLMPGLYEQEVIDVGIFNDDRIIKFTLSGGIDLYFVFFRMKSNLLVAAEGKVIDAFQNKKENTGILPEDFFSRKQEQAKKENTIKDFFRSVYRQYGDIAMKEFLYLNNLKMNDESEENIKSNIAYFIQKYAEKLKNPLYLLYKSEKNNYPSLVRLEHLREYDVTEFNDINGLVQAFLKAHYNKHSGEDLKKKAINQKEEKLRTAEKKLISLQKQIEVAENAGQYRTFGDLILANLHLVNKGDEKLVLSVEEYPDPVEIPLKRELSPAENASLYYDKYKRQKNSIDLLKEKTEVQKRNIDVLIKELEELKLKDTKSFKMAEKENPKDEETSRFRKFRLGDKFQVWVGKDSASNDLLTMRYSAQNDLWFHVRGASGSHTVLKITDKKNPPDKKTIETAASIAAYYSKARNASNIPVAYCERKYVKKKKGFKEGSVIMEKEKVIFVKPGLPENLD